VQVKGKEVSRRELGVMMVAQVQGTSLENVLGTQTPRTGATFVKALMSQHPELQPVPAYRQEAARWLWSNIHSLAEWFKGYESWVLDNFFGHRRDDGVVRVHVLSQSWCGAMAASNGSSRRGSRRW
jgi:hypothetical protein